MPTLTQLEYIIAVHNFKHFGRAAKACHVSQPSLSAQIQKVEDELGLFIFDRSKKPIITTQKGKKFIEQALIVLKEHRRFTDILGDEGEIQGQFHLGVIPTLSSSVIPLFIEDFSLKFPQVELRISEYKTDDIISMLHDDTLDAGLMVTPLKDDKLIEKSLFLEPFYIFSADSHPFCKKKIIKDSELDSESIWLLDEGHCLREQVLKLCTFKDKNTVLKNISFASGSLETLKNLIRRGRGYTLLPYLATQNLSKREKENNLIAFSEPIPTREVSFVYSRSILKKEIIDALISEITLNIPRELKKMKSKELEILEI